MSRTFLPNSCRSSFSSFLLARGVGVNLRPLLKSSISSGDSSRDDKLIIFGSGFDVLFVVVDLCAVNQADPGG